MSASDAPQRAPGLRSRSGNAMLRTRAALLEAAAECVLELGVRGTAMGQVASTAGVAKATLYNHFRTKDDVLAALVQARVAALAAACADLPVAEALECAAGALRDAPALRRVAKEEPALLVPLLVPDEGRGWEQARAAVAQVVGSAHTELVLRWLVGQLLSPLGPEQARTQAAALAAAVAAGESQGPSQGRPAERARSAGLGWPDTLRTR